MTYKPLYCPNCKKVINPLCLACNPPKFEWRCGWCKNGLRYYEREDNKKPVTQKEINAYFERKEKIKPTFKNEVLDESFD